MAQSRAFEPNPIFRQGEAEALLNVPSTLDVFATHFPRFPVLPGVVLVESLAALAVAFVDQATGARWTLVALSGVQWRQYVRPGDQLTLTVELLGPPGPAEAALRARAEVGGRVVTGIRRLTLGPA